MTYPAPPPHVVEFARPAAPVESAWPAGPPESAWPPHPGELAALALRQVGEVLGTLTAEQLADLAAGRGRLVFQPGTPQPPAAGRPPRPRAARAPGAGVDLDATVTAIRALGSRDEVADYLRLHDGRLTVPVLKEVAQRLGPTVATGRSKAELKRNIIEGTAGFRERSMAMSRGGWD